jgi:hypothetical protein
LQLTADKRRTIFRRLNLSSLLFLVPILVVPRSGLLVCILAAVPMVALGLVFQQSGGILLLARTGSKKANLGTMFLLPIGFLVLIGFARYQIFDQWKLLAVSILVGLPMAWLTCRVDLRGANRTPYAKNALWSFIAMTPLLSGYAWGVLTNVNGLSSSYPVKNYPVTVLAKHYSGGRGATHYLEVSVWGPFKYENEISVGHETYNLVKVNDVVCAQLHTGLFGFRYLAVEAPCATYSLSTPNDRRVSAI